MDLGANHVRICLYQMFNPLSNKTESIPIRNTLIFLCDKHKNNAVGHLYCAFEVLFLVDF